MAWRIAVIVCALLLAGCAQKGNPSTQDGQPSSSGSTSSVPAFGGPAAPPVTDVPTLANEMRWSSCRGLYTHFTWPSPANPAPDFDGWTERPTPTLTDIRYMALECQRFGFRQLERGPIQFLLEITNDRRPPDACLAVEPEAQVFNFVGIWSSDPEVVTAMQNEGLPAGIATFSFVDGPLPVAQLHVEWMIDGQGSSLDGLQETAESPAKLGANPWRLFWHNQRGGVSALDFGNAVNAANGPSDRMIEGMLGEPLAMRGPYAGPGFHFTESDFGGLLYRFRDVACKELQ